VLPPSHGSEASPAPLRVAIADDSCLVREAMAAMLHDAPGLEVVAVCEDRDDLLRAIALERPDVVVTDVRMPPDWSDEGIQVAMELRRTNPETGVVVLSQYADARYALDLLELGSDARAYLLKDRVHDRGEITHAVQAVARGDSVIDAKVVELLVNARSGAGASPLADLSPRERQILAEIATGKGNAAIATGLVVSKRSVEKHIHAIFSKLELGDDEDVSRRVKATLIFLAEASSGRVRRA
jgi:DNA-binding NarL/FixJ family response regulator